jgi:hypothetical protein
MLKINLEQFERRVVFRTARGYFLTVAVIALFTFAAGAFFGMKALTHIDPNEPTLAPAPPEIPPPAALTIEDVKKWRTKPVDVVDDDTPEVADLVRNVAGPKPSENMEDSPLKIALNRVKALFPDPTYAWESEYTNSCVRPSPYGCLKRERVLERKGIGATLGELIKHGEDNDEERLLRLLNAIVSALTPVDVEKRGEFLADTVFAHREKMFDYERTVEARMSKIRDSEVNHLDAVRAYEDELAEIKSTRETEFSFAGYGLALGLGLLACVGVFLAHLAIERHLRELREIMRPANRPPQDLPRS